MRVSRFDKDSKYDPSFHEFASLLIEYLGKEDLLFTRENALQGMTKSHLEKRGLLLGGELTIRVDFDGTSTE